MTPIRNPQTEKMDRRIMTMWNVKKMSAKEIKNALGLPTVWRVYDVRKRFPQQMRRARR